jgi:hypothetical protein
MEAGAHRRWAALVVTLNVIISVFVAVPDVDDRARQPIATGGADRALNEERLSRHAGRDVATQRQLRRVLDEEWAEHGRLRRAFRQTMVDRVDEHRGAEGVGQQNEFLTAIATFLPDGR